MDTAQRRAAALGVAGALATGALAVGIGEATLDAWAGWGRQEVAQGLQVLAGAAAAATSTATSRTTPTRPATADVTEAARGRSASSAHARAMTSSGPTPATVAATPR